MWCSKKTRRTILPLCKHQKDGPPGVRTPEGWSFWCSNTRRKVLLVFEHQKDVLLVFAHQKEFPYGVWDLGLRGFEWGTWI